MDLSMSRTIGHVVCCAPTETCCTDGHPVRALLGGWLLSTLMEPARLIFGNLLFLGLREPAERLLRIGPLYKSLPWTAQSEAAPSSWMAPPLVWPRLLARSRDFLRPTNCFAERKARLDVLSNLQAFSSALPKSPPQVSCLCYRRNR